MNISIASNVGIYNSPEIKALDSIAQIPKQIEAASYRYLTWSIEHPLVNSLLKIAGGIAVVTALNVIPSPKEIFESSQTALNNIGEFAQRFPDNFQPQPVNAAGLPEQLQQATEIPPCTIPNEITIQAGGSISGQLWPIFKENGITEKEELLDALSKVTAGMDNPDIVYQGDVIDLPREELCAFAGRPIVENSANFVQSTNTTQFSTEVCGLTQPLVINEGSTYWDTVRNALAAEGVPQDQIDKYYEQIVAFNSTKIPDPANVLAGTEVLMPKFEGCNSSTGEGLLYFLAAIGIIGGSVAFGLSKKKK